MGVNWLNCKIIPLGGWGWGRWAGAATGQPVRLTARCPKLPQDHTGVGFRAWSPNGYRFCTCLVVDELSDACREVCFR